MRIQHVPRALARSKVVIQGLSEHLYSRAVYALASTCLPPVMLVPMLRAYCRFYRVNTDELALPFDSYSNFREFFSRPVRPGLRPIDAGPARLTSPVDGDVLATGSFRNGPPETLRIKGKIYSLASLLGTSKVPDAFRSGGYVLFYLAPGDYHRIHSPMDGYVTAVDAIPGTCRPVNRIGRRFFPDLYVTNRRVVLWMRSDDEPALDAALVLIGAMGVGRILVDLDGISIEASKSDERHERFAEPVAVARGQEIGCFDLGSSALLVWSGDRCPTRILVKEGRVKVGECVVAKGDRARGEADA